MSIILIVDSASDISETEAKSLGITMVPMEIRFGDETYLDGVNISPKQFYDKLIESSTLPSTSQVNSSAFYDAFEEQTSQGHTVLAITISSKLSGTYQSALMAAESFGDKVMVFDSLNACVGERLLIQYALTQISAGKDIQEIYDDLCEKREKTCLMALLDTLQYLKKGGRISSFVAFSGELLSIKPVISIIDGEVRLIGKARGSKNANNLLTQLISTNGGIDFSLPYAVVYSGNECTTLDKYIEDSRHLWEHGTDSLPKYPIGCTIGSHIGPGAFGVAFFHK